MALVVITGGSRSGKSSAAERLAQTRRDDAVVVVAPHMGDDEEMRRRIEKHQAARPAGFRVVEAHVGGAWRASIAPDDCVIIECLGSILSEELGRAYDDCVASGVAESLVDRQLEQRVQQAADELVAWIVARTGDTVVVTSEVGSGVVPAYASARLFRDIVGAANQQLVEAADAAYLAVAGRMVDLSELPTDAEWPHRG